MRRTITSLATAAVLIGSAAIGPAMARDRSDRVELTASQLTDRAAARAAQLKADLRLTPEQDKNWSGVQAELVNVWKKHDEHRQSWRIARANQAGSADLIEQMRKDGDDRIERGNDLKKLADASQPLYASLDDQQKQRFGEALFHRSRDRRSD
ncbi:Spy/CpxP family protein refolding chaperone [Rhodopseudomonas sp. NSM]|uniref:Spy/CpxP family protein refolding chaperone n=1 Tax=Rhodopseudomonas sp. NSM TaxID=3457630 RepID=UPI00403754A6